MTNNYPKLPFILACSLHIFTAVPSRYASTRSFLLAVPARNVCATSLLAPGLEVSMQQCAKDAYTLAESWAQVLEYFTLRWLDKHRSKLRSCSTNNTLHGVLTFPSQKEWPTAAFPVIRAVCVATQARLAVRHERACAHRTA